MAQNPRGGISRNSAKERRERERADSAIRALQHHGIQFALPIGGGKDWRIQTGIGRELMTLAEVRAYCIGLADSERKFRALAIAGRNGENENA